MPRETPVFAPMPHLLQPPPFRLLLPLLSLVGAVVRLAGAGSIGAQELAVAELRGRVLLEDVPLVGARVVLHRVTTAESGPLDSLLTGSAATFQFRLPNVPDPAVRQEVWFTSVRHDGVNYFGDPIHLAAQLDSVQTIRVFDTETAPPGGAALGIQARYTLMDQENGQWFLTDLLHVRNDGETTLVAAVGEATWAYPLPAGASDLEVGGDQTSPDAAELVNGDLRVTSAIPPGERELVVRYRVPDPFVTLRYPGMTGEVEVLVRDPAPLTVIGLEGAAPVEIEAGVRYQRYVGGQLVDAIVSVREASVPPRLPLGWMAVGIAMALAVAGVAATLRPHPAVVPVAPGTLPDEQVVAPDARLSPFEQRQLVLLEVARLDDARERGGNEVQWAARRRALVERVRELEGSGAL